MDPHRHRIRTLVLTLAVVASFVIVPSAFAGHALATLAGSTFEVDDDANLRLDHGSPSSDWGALAHPTGPELRQTDAPTGQNDDSYKGGVKEDTVCPGETTGGIPNNKSDLLTFHVHEEAGVGDHPGFMNLAWSRVSDPSGTTLMDFEFNQSKTRCAVGPNVVRTVNDLLIEYAIDQGGSRAEISGRRWTGSAWGPSIDLDDGTGCGGGPCAVGTINQSVIPGGESDDLGEKQARTFGEAQIDLRLIFNSNQCTSFGSAMLKSRSSDAFTSQLKDFITPVPIELTNCGSIEITKTDDTGAVLAGAEFTLYRDNAPIGGSRGVEDTATTQTCTTPASGVCTIPNVLAGDYWVVETITPANHDTAPDQHASVTADTKVTLTFVNPRQRGSILVHKVVQGGTLLGGAGFTVTPGSIVMTETSTGVFCTDNLLFGQYTVTETTTPAGYQTAPSQSFTVSTNSTCATRSTTPDLTFTNNPAPGTINVQKNDDDGSPLAGAAFTVYEDVGTVGTYEPAVDTTVAAGPSSVSLSGQVSFTNLAAPANYCVVETTTPSGYETAAPQCVNLPLGTSAGTGATVNLTFVDVQQHKVIVIVCHAGTDTFAPASTGTSSALLTAGELGTGDPTQAELCALAGDEPQAHGDQVAVTVGAHP